MLSEAENPSIGDSLLEFSVLDLVRSMLRLQGIDYEVVRHGKLTHVFAKNVVIVVSEWNRPLDSRTLFNLLIRVEGRAERVLLIAKELSGHAREIIIRRNLPVVLVPDNEIMSVLDYL